MGGEQNIEIFPPLVVEVIDTPGVADTFDPFADLPFIDEQELGVRFDSLLELAAQQPDDEAALSSLRTLVNVVQERGMVSMAMQMAVTLGAMACMHKHMEGVANEVGELVLASNGQEHADDHHDGQDSHSDHDQFDCADCRAGRPCSRRK